MLLLKDRYISSGFLAYQLNLEFSHCLQYKVNCHYYRVYLEGKGFRTQFMLATY